jgi:hypothetical protein
MKTILVNESDLNGRIKQVEYAVNNSGNGLFTRKNDGTWQQHRGTCDFGAKTPADLMRKLKSGKSEFDERTLKMVRGSAFNW